MDAKTVIDEFEKLPPDAKDKVRKHISGSAWLPEKEGALPQQREPGYWKGRVKIADDFDEVPEEFFQ